MVGVTVGVVTLSPGARKMGSYLSEPITAKESSDGVLTVGKRTVRYGVTAMQGWRVDMEVCMARLSKFSAVTCVLRRTTIA